MVRFTPLDRSMVINDLRAQVAEILFEKDDGTLRRMHCTLNPLYFPEGYSVEQVDPNLITVWDLDAKDWRRFRHDKVVYIQTVNR